MSAALLSTHRSAGAAHVRGGGGGGQGGGGGSASTRGGLAAAGARHPGAHAGGAEVLGLEIPLASLTQ